MPNCPAAPRITISGMASSGRKSIIAPTPTKINNGNNPVWIPASYNTFISPVSYDIPRLASIQPKPIGSNSTGSYSLTTARTIKTPPTSSMKTLPQVRVVKPINRSWINWVGFMHASTGKLNQGLAFFNGVARVDQDRADRRGTDGADGVLHLHRFQHHQFISRHNMIARMGSD